MKLQPREQAKRFPPNLPWFIPRDLYVKIYKLMPKIYFRRFSTYFKKFGCLRCSRKRTMYGANGLCLHCLGLVSDRLGRCDRVLERQLKAKTDPGRSERFLNRVTSAKLLLIDLVAQQETARKAGSSIDPPAIRWEKATIHNRDGRK